MGGSEWRGDMGIEKIAKAFGLGRGALYKD
jgi:hypothetical protein